MNDFYIVITTIRSYQVALTELLQSLPPQLKYIVIYSKEPTNDYKIQETTIEVSIRNNIYEYGAYLGINMLLEKNAIPETSVFLFIHDTCKFGQTATEKLPPLIEEFVKGEEEIFWLEKRGLCNICLIKPKAIKEGVKRYRNFFVMDKMTAITAEWGGNGISPKKLPLKQKFHTSHAEARGSRFVYNKENKREVIYYSLIDMEKYFTAKHPTEHPQKP